MKKFLLITSFLISAILTGCAHPIVISPDATKIERPANVNALDKNVGYYLSPQLRDTAVTSPGGGGDEVTYSPYKDIETSFYKMLGNVFKNVVILKSANDTDVIQKNNIQYVITPEITTTSSSDSLITWPPTKFSVTLTCNVTDEKGATNKISVTGEGKAEFSEFKSDFSLSGKRAAQDALIKMQDALLAAPDFKK